MHADDLGLGRMHAVVCGNVSIPFKKNPKFSAGRRSQGQNSRNMVNVNNQSYASMFVLVYNSSSFSHLQSVKEFQLVRKHPSSFPTSCSLQHQLYTYTRHYDCLGMTCGCGEGSSISKHTAYYSVSEHVVHLRLLGTETESLSHFILSLAAAFQR